MPTALTGNPANGARSPAISGSGPAAADLAGGHVQFVTEIGSSLEDVYLKLVRG